METVRNFQVGENDSESADAAVNPPQARRSVRSSPSLLTITIAVNKTTVKRFIDGQADRWLYFRQSACPAHTRTILPGLRILSGSSACLMLRITDTASPCSEIKKSIF